MKRAAFLAAGSAAVGAAALPGIARAAEAAELTTPTGRLYGTLEVPSTTARVPVVLLIAGSGPTDRDGNNPQLPGKNDSLKQLALALAARGIASLRYDKRGIGASAAAGAAEIDLRFDTYVTDAVGWIADLRARNRFSRVVVAGHSEGSLIGMLAVAQSGADGFVSLEGAGRSAPVVLREQLGKQLAGVPNLLAQANRVLDELSAGRTVAEVPAPRAALFRASVQPYLISWFRYDPAKAIAAVRAPAAIVQGTADVQVTRADGDALHAALPSARYVIVEGMNHVLKHAPDTASSAAIVAGYSDPALPVEPAVVEAVSGIALL